MKATGIVRRIDDLGRVVIPKEIRRTMRIREGEAMEIYTGDDGEVVFKKYSPIGESADTAVQLCDALWRTANRTAAVCDRDRVIAAAGPYRRDLVGKGISQGLDKLLGERQIIQASPNKSIPILADAPKPLAVAGAPIIIDGDVTGCVLFAGEDAPKETEETEFKLAMAAAGFLGRTAQG